MIFTEITNLYSCLCNSAFCLFILLEIYNIFYYEDKRDICLKKIISKMKNITIMQRFFMYIYVTVQIILYDFIFYSFLLNYIYIQRLQLSEINSQIIVSFCYFIHNYYSDYKHLYSNTNQSYILRFFFSNILNRFILSIFYLHCNSIIPIIFIDICFHFLIINNIIKTYTV